MVAVWRAKEIFDAEGVSDPGKAIPGHKMARVLSLFLCGDVDKVDSILPIIRRVTNGDGLDVVTVKELLRHHLEAYDDWAPEIDRMVRWAAGTCSCSSTVQRFVASIITCFTDPLASLIRSYVGANGRTATIR